MKFNFKFNWRTIAISAFFITNASMPQTFAMTNGIDPDGIVKSQLALLNIDTATSAQLTDIEAIVNAANTFFSGDASGTPAYSDGLTLVATLKTKIAARKTALKATTGGTTTGTTTGGTTTGGTTVTKISIDQQVVNAINAAMAKPALIDKAKALNTIVATGTLKSAKVTDVTDATRNLFATKIMAAGGTLIVNINTYAIKTAYTAADKTAIKALIAANTVTLANTTTITAFSTALKTLFTNAVKTNFLTAAQKTYINNTLLKAPLTNLQKNITKLKAIK